MAAVQGASAPPWQFVIKVHSRCDLSCDHCYVYRHADQSWRTRPKVIATHIVQAAANRIAEHAAKHGLPHVVVVLHGGEPLLLGTERMEEILTHLKGALDPVTRLNLRLQTNGVLLSEAMCDLFVSFGVEVGVSLDGDRESNDRHRRFANGASSHPQVLRALALLRTPTYARAYGGLLCTVDIRNDPDRVYEALVAQAPPRIDFLLPHATWDHPPVRPTSDPTPYASWLARVYDRWRDDNRPVPIRMFDSLLSTAAGGSGVSETLGAGDDGVLVIETDGRWEQVDSLKATYPGATATGTHVLTHSVDDACAASTRPRTLSNRCQRCPVVHRCGGGLLAHRYRSGTGFSNPSVYCEDLARFIVHVDSHSLPRADSGGHSQQWQSLLSDEAVEQIGDARMTAGVAPALAASRLALVRALFAGVDFTSDSRGPAMARVAADGWHLLCELDVAQSTAVSTVLTYPYVRSWLARCLTPVAGVDVIADRAFVACVAVAVAVRARMSITATVPLRDGTLHLPTLGALRLNDASASTASVSTFDGGFTARVGHSTHTVAVADDTPAAGWHPVRRLALPGLDDVLLDDTDPFRPHFGWSLAPRLTTAEAEPLLIRLADAWHAIQTQAPTYASTVRSILRVVTPLSAPRFTGLISGSSRHAPGAVGIGPAIPAHELAVLIVHEVQHSVFGLLADLCDLTDRTDGILLRVGWRPDPRPLEAVLTGTYAHLSVADVWLLRTLASQEDIEAAERLARYQAWVRDALDQLQRVPSLTSAGRRFVEGMISRAESWRLPGGGHDRG